MKSLILIALLAALYIVSCVAQTEGDASPSFISSEHVLLGERFSDEDSLNGWIRTSDPKYTGAMNVRKSNLEDSEITALALEEEAKYYGLSKPLDKHVLFTKDSDIILQYEVKAEKKITCGGGYLKFLRGDDVNAETLKNFNNEFPYSIMFGPDVCGVGNRVHFIVQTKNHVTGKMEEHHLINPPSVSDDRLTHIYTVIIHGATDEFEVLIDGEPFKQGSLFDEFEPPFQPPTEIDDPEDSKPEDWIDDEKIPDPEAVKPEEWDEDAPSMIPDPEDEMPSTWLLDEEFTIPDPSATEPEDWDAEWDGEWEAPVIDNPLCEAAPGCGPWTPRNIPNPDYYGPWEAPLIDNPEYIGEWKPRQIANPEFFELKEIVPEFAPITAVGIEIWTMTSGILISDILIADDMDVAESWREEFWRPKHAVEDAYHESHRKKMNERSVIDSAMEFMLDAWEKKSPLAVGSLLIAVLLPIAVVVFRIMGSKKPKADNEEEEEEEEEEEKEETVITEKVMDEPKVTIRQRSRNVPKKEKEEEKEEGEKPKSTPRKGRGAPRGRGRHI